MVTNMDIYGLPQPLTGEELVTIFQEQNGVMARCTMPLSQLSMIIKSTEWVSSLPKTTPTVAGVAWNNNGVVSIS